MSQLTDIEQHIKSSHHYGHWSLTDCVTLDRAPSTQESNEIDYETRFLLLGCYSEFGDGGLGLILNPAGDGTFKRIGLIYTHEDDMVMMEVVWPRRKFPRQVVAII